MIQDIGSHVFDNHMCFEAPRSDDALLAYRPIEGSTMLEVLMRERGGKAEFPTFGLFEGKVDTVHAFTVDGRRFFLALPGSSVGAIPDGWEFRRVGYLDRIKPNEMALAAMTGVHLFFWYRNNQFCGKCGGPLAPSDRERALVCGACGRTVYPKINPVVIVALVDKGRLLTIRYAGPRGTHRALVAGFVEIGETAEQAVLREIAEETGLRAKNVRYVCSQPWGYAQELILGFTAELDGVDEIVIDERELANAAWTLPEEIDFDTSNPSLTYELMRRFKAGEL